MTWLTKVSAVSNAIALTMPAHASTCCLVLVLVVHATELFVSSFGWLGGCGVWRKWLC